MMEASDAPQSDDLPALFWSRLDCSGERTILAQSHVRPIFMIVFNVRANELAKVAFTERDNIGQQLSPE